MYKHKQAGFTLIELAVVLFIVGLLLGGLLVPFATSIEQRDRTDTESKLSDIKEALHGFALVNGRLPCPDCEASSGCGVGTPDDGLEDMNGVNCSVQVGNLPWSTLNISQFDAWGYPFTYKVTAVYSRALPATTFVAPCTSSTGAAFDLCTPGDMYISRTDSITANVADNIAAIVISHGKNHYSEVQTPEEVENYERIPFIFGSTTEDILTSYAGDTANRFVYKDYTLLGGDIAFDDLIIWISPSILKYKLINAGKLP